MPTPYKKVILPAMKREAIAETIAKIKPGDTVTIQFRAADVYDVTYLLGMHTNGFLTVDGSDVLCLMAIAESREWGGPATNRIFRLHANSNWDLNWFSGRLSKRLEAVTIETPKE